MANDLPTLVQNLPQELYDEIYGLVFASSSTTHRIRDSYRPPNGLQVSRTSRRRFAELYYSSKSTFTVSKHLAAKYLCSLESSHLDLMRDIRITGTLMLLANISPNAQGRKRLNLFHLFRVDGCLRELLGKALLANNVLKFKVAFSSGKMRWASLEELLAGVADEH